jgi:hypothetical protein
MSDSKPEYPPLPPNIFAESAEYPQIPLPPSAYLSLPTSAKMALSGEPCGAAGKPPEFSFSSRVIVDSIDKPASVKLDNITVLEGQSNYNIWASTMVIIIKEMNCYEIVVEGMEPAEDAEKDEIAAFEHLSYQAQAIFIQLVCSSILEKMVELGPPYMMWSWLRTKYYRDTAYAFVY